MAKKIPAADVAKSDQGSAGAAGVDPAIAAVLDDAAAVAVTESNDATVAAIQDEKTEAETAEQAEARAALDFEAEHKKNQLQPDTTSQDGLEDLTRSAASATAPEIEAARKLAEERLKPLNDAAAAAGATIVNEDGSRESVGRIFEVKAATTPSAAPAAPSGATFTVADGATVCPKCALAFESTKGLRRHITSRHGGAVVVDVKPAAAPAPAAEAAKPRPERKVEPQTVKAEDKGAVLAVEIDALELFKLLGDHLPPPLEDWEVALLKRAPVKIAIPMWLFKMGVYAIVLGPRLYAKFFVLKEKFDKEAAAKDAEIAAKRATAAAERKAVASRKEVPEDSQPADYRAGLEVPSHG